MSFFKNETKNKFKLPDYLKEPVKNVAGSVTDVMAQPYEAYKGPRTAGLTGGQTTAMSGLEKILGNAPKLQTPGTVLDGFEKYMNPYTAAVNDAAVRQLREGAQGNLQAWDAAANMAGAFGDTGWAAGRGDVTNQVERNVADTTSRNYSDAFKQAMALSQQDIANMLTSNDQAMRDTALQVQELQSLFGMGTTQQQAEQAGMDRDFQEFLRQQGYDEQQIAWAASVLGSLPQGTMVQKNTPSTASTITGIASGIGSIFS